jgi:acetyl esterase
MPLDPVAKAMLDGMRSMGIELYTPGITAVQMRQQMVDRKVPTPVKEVAAVEDRVVVGADGNEIPVRIYRPAVGGEPLPVVVFFHGGGWVIGGIDSHDGTVRSLVDQTGAVFVSVDYRLAPEHPFPAAPEDCYAATRWVAEHADELNVDASRLAVAGDSAGGNLAAVVPLMARDRGGPSIAFQLLVYPCTDFDMEKYPSMTENAEGYFLSQDVMVWFYDCYVTDDAHRSNPYAAPITSPDLAGLPPALVITGEFDPLRDEGEAYGKRLAEAGVPTTVTRYDGMIHGFFSMDLVLHQGKDAQAQASAALREALGL